MRLALLVLLFAGPFVAAQEPESWKGQKVVGKKPAADIKFGDWIDGKQVYFRFEGHYPITVRDDKDGWLRLFDGHKEGWADKGDFVLSRDAPAYFTDRIRANPNDDFAYQMRGMGWHDRGDYDNALKDYTECIRIDPRSAAYFNSRGITWHAKKEYDKAIRDYDEAIRLDPKFASAYFNRSVAQMLTRKPAVEGFRQVLEVQGWKGDLAVYAVILGHCAARLEKDEQAAAKFLKDSAGKLDEAWPYPSVQYLRGEIDEEALLKLATDDDKRTEARCFLGLDHLLKGNTDKALAHFRWVKEKGNVDNVEYTIAVAELERLENAK
jgi:lipoprotein NlpI